MKHHDSLNTSILVRFPCKCYNRTIVNMLRCLLDDQSNVEAKGAAP